MIKIEYLLKKQSNWYTYFFLNWCCHDTNHTEFYQEFPAVFQNLSWYCQSDIKSDSDSATPKTLKIVYHQIYSKEDSEECQISSLYLCARVWMVVLQFLYWTVLFGLLLILINHVIQEKLFLRKEIFDYIVHLYVSKWFNSFAFHLSTNSFFEPREIKNWHIFLLSNSLYIIFRGKILIYMFHLVIAYFKLKRIVCI